MPLQVLKNAVIGSNRQKGAVIMQGIVPRLITMISNEQSSVQLRLDAAIIISKWRITFRLPYWQLSKFIAFL